MVSLDPKLPDVPGVALTLEEAAGDDKLLSADEIEAWFDSMVASLPPGAMPGNLEDFKANFMSTVERLTAGGKLISLSEMPPLPMVPGAEGMGFDGVEFDGETPPAGGCGSRC